MSTLTVLYGTPTDPDAFRAHYENVHVPLATAMPGATNVRYDLHVTTVTGDPVFAMFQADFASPDALQAAMGSPEGALAQADVPGFATGTVTILVTA